MLNYETGIKGSDIHLDNPFVDGHVVTAAEVTATKVVLNTGFKANPKAFFVQIYRDVAGVKTNVMADAKVTWLTLTELGQVKFESGAATYVLTAGDIIMLQAYKA